MEQATQRDGRCPNPENILGQVGPGSEQADLVADAPAHCRAFGSLKVPPNPNHSMTDRIQKEKLTYCGTVTNQ